MTIQVVFFFHHQKGNKPDMITGMALGCMQDQLRDIDSACLWPTKKTPTKARIRNTNRFSATWSSQEDCYYILKSYLKQG